MSDQDPSTDLANVNAAYRWEREENDRLEAENQRLREGYALRWERLAALEAENRRLRQALGEVQRLLTKPLLLERARDMALETARQALGVRR